MIFCKYGLSLDCWTRPTDVEHLWNMWKPKRKPENDGSPIEEGMRNDDQMAIAVVVVLKLGSSVGFVASLAPTHVGSLLC